MLDPYQGRMDCPRGGGLVLLLVASLRHSTVRDTGGPHPHPDTLRIGQKKRARNGVTGTSAKTKRYSDFWGQKGHVKGIFLSAHRHSHTQRKRERGGEKGWQDEVY